MFKLKGKFLRYLPLMKNLLCQVLQDLFKKKQKNEDIEF